MHNLFILGSPRTGGNTETMAQAVAAGLQTIPDNSVEFIHLNTLSIRPCQACDGCSKTGQCVITDDMVKLYQSTDDADRIFFVSPIYFYAMSAQIKAYIDRCQATWARKYLLGQRHRVEDSRSGHLISCAATNGAKLFDGAILTVKNLCDTLDLQYGTPLLFKNLETRTALKNLPDKISACEEFGALIASGK